MNSIMLDLGGTHLRLAFLENSEITKIEVFDSPKNQKELFEHIEEFLQNYSSASSLFAAIAGPIETNGSNQVVKLTNLGFSVSKNELEELTHLKVQIINDLHALAISIPFLGKEQIQSLIQEKAKPEKDAKIGIISCGTGLGVAFLTDGTRSFPSEAGHIEFAPTTDLEWELFLHMKKSFPHVSYERILSGSSQHVYLDFFQNQTNKIDPNLIWWQIVGRFAASVALMNLCEGGIYLAGGYLRSKLKEISKYKDAFEISFFDKGRLSRALKMSVSLILHPNPELIGLERLASQNR